MAAGTYSLTVVAQDNAGATTTSAARSITVTGTSLPAGWTGADIGQPAVAGSARHNTGTFTVDGAGVDIWDTTDQFQYVYRQFTGDIEIISRVVSLENSDEFAKAGVMVREALTANAAHISMVVTPGRGGNVYERPAAGNVTSGTPTGAPGAPYWVRLERRGTVVTAFQSSDGVTWTSVGTMTMATATMYVGLAVTSHNASTVATGVFDNVVVRTPAPVNQAPTAALTAPANGATFPAPATVTMTANASDTDGTIARVDFFQGTTLVGSDTTSPYSVTWNNVAAGTYSLTAVARDDDGATTTSAARTITRWEPAVFEARCLRRVEQPQYGSHAIRPGDLCFRSKPEHRHSRRHARSGQTAGVRWRVRRGRDVNDKQPSSGSVHRNGDRGRQRRVGPKRSVGRLQSLMGD